MNYIRHIFGYWTALFFIEEPEYLYGYYYCKMCNKRVDDMFESKGLNVNEFGSGFEQEQWLNEKTPCLTVEEKSIKDLLE